MMTTDDEIILVVIAMAVIAIIGGLILDMAHHKPRPRI